VAEVAAAAALVRSQAAPDLAQCSAVPLWQTAWAESMLVPPRLAIALESPPAGLWHPTESSCPANNRTQEWM